MAPWLTPAGVASALAIGLAVIVGAGWRGLVVLAVFFVGSSLLTTGGGGRRPAQVFANGGAAALAALLVRTHPAAALAFAGALAAAASDTWSTEIGQRGRQAPRMLTSGAPVPAGTSGGVTLLGLAGGAAGALVVAATAALTGLVPARAWPWIAAAGFAGGLIDSLLGATLQGRWRCPRCGAVVESPRHWCGEPLIPASGLPWMTNDTVNAAATLAGALLASLPVLWS